MVSLARLFYESGLVSGSLSPYILYESHVTESERERRARVLEHAATARSLLEHAPKREHKQKHTERD